MFRFSAALRTALNELSWTQTKLAEVTGIRLNQLNKYVASRVEPGADIVEQICKSLPAEQRVRVICAYLEDKVPESGNGLVKITGADGKQESSPRMPDNLPEEIKTALEGLAKAALKDVELASLLGLLERMIGR